MNERITKLEAVFHAAMDLASPDERERYLSEACTGDQELLREVGALLKSAAAADSVFQAGQEACRVNDALPAVVTEKPGDRIGCYKLLQQIGEGGCGVVYMAEQEEPVRRKVALKIIKLGMDTKQVVARFEAERQALALMDHPHIAKVLEAGATGSGRPYFAMELVRGIKITTYCDDNGLSTARRLDLFVQVCKAVQHAHQKGIIHRDLKPSNILVADHDGVPVPKIIDFGIAKATTDQRLTDKTLFTAFEQFIGTPAYMSPEQAKLSGLDIDTRTDIYSLGVLLYELLTGRTPLDQQELLAAGLDEMRRQIREVEPPRPSTRLSTMAGAALTTTAKHRQIDAPRLVHQVRGDLDWIVMKCLEKDRNRRYETANGLAADINRHLASEPVSARPPSTLYRLQKSVRRNTLAFAAGIAVASALVMGLGISTMLLVKERHARERAVAAERVAETARANESAQRQQAQEERARAETAEKKAETEARFMKDMLKGVGPAVALGRDTKLLSEILDETARRLKTDLTNQPAVEADLRETLGVVYRDLTDYTNAVAMLKESLVLRSNLYGRTNAAVASSLHNLAEVFWLQWKNREAAAMFREALAIRTNLNKPLDVAASMFGLAETLRRDGAWRVEAEKLHLEALAIRRKLLGKHTDVAMSLVGLGITLKDFGKPHEAETNQTEAVTMLRELHGDLHPNLAYALLNLGGTLVRIPGREADAETNLLQALAIQQKLFGDHGDTGQTLGFLGDVYVEQGRLAEAEAMYRQRLQIAKRRDHQAGRPGMFSAPFSGQIALSGVLRLQGKPEAEEVQREALELFRALIIQFEFTYPSTHWLHELAKALHHHGKPAEVEALLVEARKARERLFNNELSGLPESETNLVESVTRPGTLLRQSLGIARAFSNLGFAFTELDKPAEAEVMFCEAIRVEQPAGALQFAHARLRVASLLIHEGKRSEAESQLRVVAASETAEDQNYLAWYLATWADPQERDGRRAAYHAEKAVAATNRKNANYLDTLAAAFARAGEFTNAVSVQREAIALVPDPKNKNKKDYEFRLNRYLSKEAYVDHVNLAQSAVVLLAVGKFAAAEPLSRDCVRMLEKEQPDGRLAFNARSLLGGALIGQGKFAEAEPVLLSCYEGLKQINSPPSVGEQIQREVLQRLVQLYEATARTDEVTKWKRQLAELDHPAK